MTAAPRTITLGGRDYPIAPLTLGQMRNVGPAFTRIAGDTPEGMAAQITVIHAAISAADPTIKVSDVDALVGVTLYELTAAIAAIAELIGLNRRLAATGEAPAPPSTDAQEAAPALPSIG